MTALPGFRSAPASRRSLLARLRGGWPAYLFLLPTLLLVGYFSYFPAYTAITRAFTDWDGLNVPTFTGLENFQRAVTDPVMGQATLNMAIWVGLGLLLAVVPPLLISELIFHLRGKKRQYAYRTLFVLPIVIPSLVLLLVWGAFYRSDGLLNALLGAVGLEGLRHDWLSDPDTALLSLIFLGFPYVDAFNFLLLYAGLQNIPDEVFDAARIDGATGWRRVLRIDLPLLRPQLGLIALLAIIGNVQYFISPLVLTSGGPGFATTVPALLMYQTATRDGEYGYAMAMAVLLMIVVVALTGLSRLLGRGNR
ncbi:carbohydrate ABC transporter permease [Deinococcus budaensis]|uniref:Raffinose/stachyose/melibiose transport system permease protein n=1 Tax=Deinococcus budaensis TaxID=1665626 RepID=A0A7W8GG68_9DEIO|nr:sugar ABC transporter permease [Deinococcus budaensis]MBB5235082.1 raffinose/stachyose/melibiose transport system permease protein [Deinococcus budaensis]